MKANFFQLALLSLLLTTLAPAQDAPAPHKCPICGKVHEAEGAPVTSQPVNSQETKPDSPQATDSTGQPAAAKAPPVPPPSLLARIPDAVWMLLVGGVGLYVWLGIIQPRKRRQGLTTAKALLATNSSADFPKVEELLTESLTAGMGKTDVAEARFQLAFTRARMGKYTEAEAVLADSERASEPGGEGAYLRLWLLARLRKHEEVEGYYEKRRGLLKGVLDADRLVGITFLHLARKHWSRKQAEAALAYFDKLRALNVLTEHIPADMGDQRIVFGLMALFDEDTKKAQAHFTAARDAAVAEKKSPHASSLGLLLCTWREEELPQIDDELTDVIDRTETAMGKNRSDEDRLLLGHLRVWHLLSLLISWMIRPRATALTAEDEMEFNSRAEAAERAIPKAGDALLIRGLMVYFLSDRDSAARDGAVDILAAALDRDVNLPEISLIVDREKERRKRRLETVSTYHDVLASYVSDQAVPAELRKALIKRFSTDDRFQDLGEITIHEGPAENAPTVQDLLIRVKSHGGRLHSIVKDVLNQASPEVAKQLDSTFQQLDQTNDEIVAKTREIENLEQKAMLAVGEVVIAEEQTSES